MNEWCCETCKFWHPQEEGECECPKFIYSGQIAGEELIARLREVAPNKDYLLYWDIESYAAYFSTGPNFGCKHWEKADK